MSHLQIFIEIIIFQDLARLEEEQSRERTPEEDAQLFSATCADIRNNLKDMLDLKVGPRLKSPNLDLPLKVAGLDFLK